MEHTTPHPELSFDPEPKEHDRRTFLLAATATVGGIGALFTAYPFVDSMEPSARAQAAAAPVEVDASGLSAGDMITVAWRGKPIWVLKRSPEMIKAIDAPNPALADPTSKSSMQPKDCDNLTRSIRPDLFVAVGICTHLGCSPMLRLHDASLNAELHEPGGFYCPCHGSKFDLAGRVMKGVPAPTNLVIPPYRFKGATKIVVG
ncbi:MAG: ubiquinol-cytochrome c reductase iron-sulfur subunit [Betaproteobacteria bacterium]|nr:ubiquinol-cytochrome c reductase iron-sulfur subunit [Betaproteobacteria bacterium]